MEDFLCSICRCDMPITNFILCTQDEIIEDCVRFKCGHAFHANCACLSLRITDKCPVCRSSDTVPVEDIQTEIIDLINGPLMENSMRATEILALAGKSSRVQLARRKLNASLRAFRLFEHSVKYQRCQEIKKAVKTIKDEKHKDFLKFYNNIKKGLKKLKNEESLEAAKIEVFDIESYISYNIDGVLASELLKKKFWEH